MTEARKHINTLLRINFGYAFESPLVEALHNFYDVVGSNYLR